MSACHHDYDDELRRESGDDFHRSNEVSMSETVSAAGRHGPLGYDPGLHGSASSSGAPYAIARPGVLFSTSMGDVRVDASARMSFPSRGEIARAKISSILDVPNVLSKAPWWHRDALHDERLFSYYVGTDGFLPDGHPATIRGSFDFENRCLVDKEELSTPSNGCPAVIDHIQKVYERRNRMKCNTPIPVEYGTDAYCHRTFGEIRYVEWVQELEIDQWRGVRDVAQGALSFPCPILRAEFRYALKYKDPYWKWAKWERRVRIRDGLFAPYHSTEYESIARNRRRLRYVNIPEGWWSWEVPEHCYADLPPVLAYYGSQMLRDSQSGWWVVFYTEWCAKVASFILWDGYDQYKLWRLPSSLVGMIEKLDLTRVLGSTLNQLDFHHLLGVIKSTDWTNAESTDLRGQRRRASHRHYTARGEVVRHRPGEYMGEFIFYDPWKRVRLDEQEARNLRENRPRVPREHPTGFWFELELPVAAVRALLWAPKDTPLFYEEEDDAEDGGEYEDLDDPVRRGRTKTPAGSSLQHAVSQQCDAVHQGDDKQTAIRNFMAQFGMAPDQVTPEMVAQIEAFILSSVVNTPQDVVDTDNGSALPAPESSASETGESPMVTEDTPVEGDTNMGDHERHN